MDKDFFLVSLMIVSIPLLIICITVLFCIPFVSYWYKTLLAKAPLSFTCFIGLKFRNIPIPLIIENYILLCKNGLVNSLNKYDIIKELEIVYFCGADMSVLTKEFLNSIGDSQTENEKLFKEMCNSVIIKADWEELYGSLRKINNSIDPETKPWSVFNGNTPGNKEELVEWITTKQVPIDSIVFSNEQNSWIPAIEIDEVKSMYIRESILKDLNRAGKLF